MLLSFSLVLKKREEDDIKYRVKLYIQQQIKGIYSFYVLLYCFFLFHFFYFLFSFAKPVVIRL